MFQLGVTRIVNVKIIFFLRNVLRVKWTKKLVICLQAVSMSYIYTCIFHNKLGRYIMYDINYRYLVVKMRRALVKVHFNGRCVFSAAPAPTPTTNTIYSVSLYCATILLQMYFLRCYPLRRQQPPPTNGRLTNRRRKLVVKRQIAKH